MVELKKIETHLKQLLRKKTSPPPFYPSGSLQNFNNSSASTCHFFKKKKLALLSFKKKKRITDKAECFTQSFFAHTGTEGHVTWLELMLENILEITITRFA